MKKISLFIVVSIIIITVGGCLTLPKGPKPGTFSSLHERYNVKILRDNWGVPHIYGKTDPDTAFGLAYAHSEDDFPTIADALLTCRGELASLKGKEHAPIDYLAKLLKVNETVEENYSSLPEDVRQLCEAYADGLNFYVSQHPDELPSRYLPIRGQDIVAGFVFKGPFFYGLDNEIMKLFRDERARPVSKKNEEDQTAQAVEQWLNKEGMTVGSNTAAVAPSRTPDGSTYLNINSHQPWDGPVAWYEAHLNSEEGWNCVGGLFPGTPIILVGHNEHLGWAHTVNSPDLIDIYVLEMNPDNPNQYKFDGEWLDLEVREVPLEVKLFGPFRWTVKQEALWSVHGPAVRQDHGVYAIRYSNMGDVDQVEQWYRMNKATNFEEWEGAMRMQANASLNAGYADKEGNIAYIYNAKAPVRDEGYNWEQYLPGDTSETLWDEYIPYDAMPMVINPASGFIQNCNNTPFQTTTGPENPSAEDFSATLGFETYMSNRGQRYLELLGADESITWEEFHTYKFDDAYSEASDEVTIWRELAEAQSDNPLTQEALNVWRKWDFRTNKENTSAAIVMLTLRPNSNDEGVELNEESIQEILDEMTWAAGILKEKHGRIDVAWGEVSRVIRGEVNMPVDGGPDTLRAIYSVFKRDGELVGIEDGQLDGKGGDCYFMLVRWDAAGNLTSESMHQYGSATLRKDSKHYDDQSPLFARKEMRTTLFTKEAVLDNLEREYAPGE